MNLKKLLSLSFLLVLLTAFTSTAFAQTTYFVDVDNGLDGYDGLSSTVTGAPGVGPKKTINNAIAAASDGDIISIAYANGNLYNETVLVNDKELTFRTTSGTPLVYGLKVDVDKAVMDAKVPSRSDDFTLEGPIKVSVKLEMFDGDIIGAGNITAKTEVEITNGTVDAQLSYDGAVNFEYLTNAAITSGLELPTSTNTTNLGNLTTTNANTDLTLNESKTMNGALSTAGDLDLSGGTLTIVGANAGHSLGGDVNNGTLAFNMVNGGASVAGAVTIDNLTATSDASARTLNIAVTTADDVTANAKATIDFSAGVTFNDVVNNGSGIILVDAAGNKTFNSITNISTGLINIDNGTLDITTNVINSGVGAVDFAGVSGAVDINGYVTNNPTINFSQDVANKVAGSNYGVIIFPIQDVDIAGTVTVATTLAGTNGTANSVHANVGEVRFLGTTQAVTLGGLVVNTTSSIAKGSGNLSLTNSGGIVFSQTEGDITIGDVIQNSNIPDVANATITGNGDIDMTSRDDGTGGTGNSSKITMGNIILSSVSGTNGANGNIDLVPADPVLPADADDKLSFGSIKATGGKGGYFNLGNEPYGVTGSIIDEKTEATTFIKLGSAPTAGIAISVGGNVEVKGKGNIEFTSFNGAGTEAFSVTGKVIVSGAGTMKVADAAHLGGTGTFALGGIEISAGTLDLTGAATSDMKVVVSGNTKFEGGTVVIKGLNAITTALNNSATVAVAAGDRALHLGGLSNIFSTASTTTTFDVANTLLFVQPTTVQAAQTLTGNSAETVWPSSMLIANTTGLTPAVTITGGNFRVLGDVAFTSSKVNLDDKRLFIGGQLAPNAGAGDFYNHAGYVTTGNAFISMNGNGAAAVGGAGTFQNFEVDMTGMVVTVAASTGAFTSTFNLTAGTVAGGATVIFNNSETYPTIVRNAGTFAVAPTFTSMVNVYYIGLDKTTANELPAANDKLNNLTVATTNGTNVAGKGVVNVGVATTINGKVNIFAGQTLLIDGVDVTMKGDTLTLAGDIANNAAGDELILARATGTAIIGSGLLPDVKVAINSSGNKIEGSRGLQTILLGADKVRGGVADKTTADAAAGSIVMNAGTAVLDLTMGTKYFTSHLAGITTNHANNVLNIKESIIESGKLDHNAGTITVDSSKVLTYTHTVMDYDKVAKLQGKGKLFIDQNADTDVTLTVTSGNATIDVANVEFDLDGPGPGNNDNFDVTGNDVTFTGDVTITDGDVELTKNVTLTGKNFTVATDGATVGAGVLTLKPSIENSPLQWSFAGTPVLASVKIDGDVDMVGTGTAITATALNHTSGILNFGDRDVTTAAFTRTAGSYVADKGYLILTGTFAQGDGFSIPNLKVSANLTVADKDFTVEKNLGLTTSGVLFDNKPVSTNRLKLGIPDSSLIPTIHITGTANLDAAPTFAQGKVNYVFSGATATTIASTSLYWPSDMAANTVTIDNSAVAGPNVLLDDNRTIDGLSTLKLVDGELRISLNKTLTLADSITIEIDAAKASLTVDPNGATAGTGTLVAPNVNLVYKTNSGTTGDEYTYPTAIASLTVDVGTTINDARTIAGKVDVNQNLTINANTTVNDSIDIADGKLLIVDNAAALPTYTLTTLGSVIFNGTASMTGSNGNLAFAGASGQTLAAPTNGATIPNVTINMTGVKPILYVTGGSLDITNILTFVNGIVVNSSAIRLPNPTVGATVGGLCFDRTGVIAPKVSHIAGPVKREAKTSDGRVGTNGRFVFPVGSEEGEYREAAITFTPSYVVVNPVDIIVQSVDGKPTGSVGLPLDGGDGVIVGNYPDFSWDIETYPTNLSNSQLFDLDLQATNIGFPYKDYRDIRIIKRADGNAEDNIWELQGDGQSYSNSNSFSGTDTTVVVRTTASPGGILNSGTIFTYGMPSLAPSFVSPSVDTYTMNNGDTTKIQFTAIANEIGVNITGYTMEGPEFAKIDATTGLVTLLPTEDDVQAEAYSVKVTATSSKDEKVSKSISITVKSAPVSLAFTSFINDTTAKAANAFSFQYTAKGGDGNYVFSIDSVSGTATDTAAITADGLLTWTPKATDVGKVSVLTVKVKSGTDSVTTVDSITIVNNTAPSWIAEGASFLPKDTTIYVGDTLKWTYKAIDADGDEVTYKFGSNFPEGEASLNATTGEFEWVPVTGSAFPVIVPVYALDSEDSTLTEARVTIKVITVAVTGTVKYNVTNAPIQNALVSLKDAEGNEVDTDSTDAEGKYEFDAVAAGEYTVTASKTNGFGGVMASDALMILKDAAGTDSLKTDLQKVAADVDKSGEIDAIDALLVLNRSVDNKLETFTLADWQFETVAVKVTSAGASKDILGICAGDVRSDYNPAGGIAKASVSFDNTEVQKIKKSEEFKLPVSVKESAQVGSFTLKFRYPADQIEFLGVVGSGVISNVDGDVISLAYANATSPLKIKEEGVLAQLRFKAVEGFEKGDEAGLELLDGAEITDVTAKTLASTIAISSVKVGIPETFDLGQNYPNPFNPTTTIKYGLPANGKVSLTVFNTLGQAVKTLVDTKQEAGEYEIKFNASTMASGVYLYRIIVTGGAKDFVQTKKMLLLK